MAADRPTPRDAAVSWRLHRTGETVQLVRDGAAQLLLGGQVHNSTPSDPAALGRAMDRIVALGGNVVLAPITWQRCEREEGVFDFSDLERAVESARDRALWLIPLWFGAFKNAASTYAPRWVREDVSRFPRAQIGPASGPAAFSYDGAMPKPVLSVFGGELVRADRTAFAALMRHLDAIDHDGTVPLVQVENEVGILGDSRDRSEPAQAAWSAPVPDALVDALESSRESSLAGRLWSEHGRHRQAPWEETFGAGPDADEIFMAAGFAQYVESVASAGSRHHDVPLYANAWLGPQPGAEHPGQYPSGGPTARVLDVWASCAPSVAFLAPDIYVDDGASVVRAYSVPGRALFVPECRPRAGELLRAVGSHAAVGWSVFGVEDVRVDGQLGGAFRAMLPLAEIILTAQREHRITAIVLEPGETERTFELGGCTVVARATRLLFERMLLDAGVALPPAADALSDETEGTVAIASPADDRPVALMIWVDDATFYLVGRDITVDLTKRGEIVEIDDVETGTVIDGRWQRGATVNGDERLRLLPLDRIGVVKIRLLRRSADDE